MKRVGIVGTGPTGVAAALELVAQGHCPILFDVGLEGSGQRLRGNLYELRAQEPSQSWTTQGEGLQGMVAPTKPAKLYSPLFEFVTRGVGLKRRLDGFGLVESFAKGGLANAWGAGLFPFVEKDLVGIPVQSSELKPYFERLAPIVGLSGSEDDLTPHLGKVDQLNPALKLSENAQSVLDHYEPGRVLMGRPYLAVDSSKCQYDNLEFWDPSQEHLYRPSDTLHELEAQGRVQVEQGWIVESFVEDEGGVRVLGRGLAGEARSMDLDAMILCANAAGTGQIVLQSHKAFGEPLGIVDNPAVQIPLLLPRRLGAPLQTKNFGLAQLIVVDPEEGLQGTLMDISSPMRSWFYSSLPLSAQGRLFLIKHLLPSLMVFQLFYPSDATPSGRLVLREDGTLEVSGSSERPDKARAREILRSLRRTGAWALDQVPVPYGHAIHYAGTLPMRENPEGPFECHPSGLLGGSKRVFVGDGSGFARIPAKNASFAMMANAMRVAHHLHTSLVS